MLLVWDVAGGSEICRVPPDQHPDKDAVRVSEAPTRHIALWVRPKLS